MTTTPKALPAKVSIDEDVRVLREAVDAVPRLEWTYGAGVVTIPETEEDNSEGRINFRAILNKLVAPKFGRFVSAASPARIARLLAAVESLRGNAPVADSLASAGGVEVVAYLVSGGRIFKDQAVTHKDSARTRIAERKDGSVAHPLVKQSDYLAALSKEREVADGLRAELNEARQQQASALDLVSRIRFALGDNGKRMQDELIEWCKGLEAAQRDADRLGWIQAHDSIDIEQVQRECPDDADLWMVTGYSPEGAEHKVLGHGPSLREAIDAAIEAGREG